MYILSFRNTICEILSGCWCCFVLNLTCRINLILHKFTYQYYLLTSWYRYNLFYLFIYSQISSRWKSTIYLLCYSSPSFLLPEIIKLKNTGPIFLSATTQLNNRRLDFSFVISLLSISYVCFYKMQSTMWWWFSFSLTNLQIISSESTLILAQTVHKSTTFTLITISNID